jgi:hypothetical protein
VKNSCQQAQWHDYYSYSTIDTLKQITMNQQDNSTAVTTDAKEVVISFIKALNGEDFESARTFADENIKFIGVLGTRDGAEAYFKDMERMKLKYEIKKIFVDNQDVCLFYDINMSGKNISSCGWYHVENSKITWFKVIFDPRPILEAPGKSN